MSNRSLRRATRWLPLAASFFSAMSPALADDYPAEVSAVIAGARKYCEDNGGKFAATPAAVRKAALNGDSRDDYIVDLNEASCDGVGGAFCGTGGCEISILVATPSGRFVTVFNNQVLDYEILSETHAMKFQLHGSYCGGHGGGSRCIKTHRITAKPFKYVRP